MVQHQLYRLGDGRHVIECKSGLLRGADRTGQDAIKRWKEIEEVRCLYLNNHNQVGVVIVLAHAVLTGKWELLRLLSDEDSVISFNLGEMLRCDEEEDIEVFNTWLRNYTPPLINKSRSFEEWITVEWRQYNLDTIALILYQLFNHYIVNVCHPDGQPLHVCTSKEFWREVVRYIPGRVDPETKRCVMSVRKNKRGTSYSC